MLPKPAKIAIIGCCVSRDNFTTQFNPDYKDYFDCVLYTAQSSIISIMSDPVDYPIENIIKVDTNTNKDHLQTVTFEIDKTYLKQLNQIQPDYLILDFWADVHFGVFKMKGNQYVTNNEYRFNNTEFKKVLESCELIKLSTNTEQYLSLWRRSLEDLFTYLNKMLPNTKVIINKARNAKYFYNKLNKKIELSTEVKSMVIDVEFYNQLWEMLDDYVISTYDVGYIDLTFKEYFSYEEHPWGRFFVHYTKEFYEDFIFELRKLVHRDMQNGLTERKCII